MRLVTFELSTPVGAVRRAGTLLAGGERVVDLAAAHAARLAAGGLPVGRALGDRAVPCDLLELLQGEDPALEAARAAVEHAERSGDEAIAGLQIVHALAEVRLLTPLPRPTSIRNFSLVEQHMLSAIEVMNRKKIGGEEPSLSRLPPEWYRLPAFYKTTVEEVYGPDDVIPWPELTDFFDYELELAAVIGRTGRAIAAEDATPFLAGFMLYNDWSARDFQQREMSVNLGPGLCKDFASSLGPCLVTPDAFDVAGARLTARIDGETWTDTTSGLRVGFEELIEYTSQVMTLMPGDVLTSGTVAGGSGSEQERWLAPGAVVEVEAEGIGVLRNVVGAKGAPVDLPASQRPWTRAIPQ
jgi:2-keto-4-pentenoate hydratase/2-oxohepta-3-ene-1,7-dioic acid hydratase in catechol pathway